MSLQTFILSCELDANLWQSLRDGLRPPQQTTTSEWAEKNRILTSDTSAEYGPWKNNRTPYLVDVMNALTPYVSPYSRIIFVKASQLGGTEAGNNWIGTLIDLYPSAILYVMGSKEEGEFNSQLRLDTLIDSSPVLKKKVAAPKSRDSKNSKAVKQFPGGIIKIVGTQSAKTLKSLPAPFMFCDEVDEYPDDVQDQGDPIAIIMARSRTFRGIRKLYEVSSPGKPKGRSRIENDYLKTDQRKFFLPCPHCGHKQWLKWGQIKYTLNEKGELIDESVHYQCENSRCEKRIDEHHKTKMLAAGEWLPTAKPRQKNWIGFHLNSLYSPLGWHSWSDMVADWLEAMADLKLGKPEKFKAFLNTQLAETWEEEAELHVDADSIMLTRVEEYPPDCDVPDDIVLLTAGVDVQTESKNPRLEVLVWGWGENEEAALIDKVVLYGDPFLEEVWEQLDEVLFTTTYKHESSAEMSIQCTFVDASDGNISNVIYDWTKARELRHVYSIKGRGGDGVPLLNNPSIRKPSGAKLITLGVDEGKAEVMARLSPRRKRGGGYMRFPANRPWVTQDLFAQITGEHRIRKNGNLVWDKKSASQRVEDLDNTVYAFAAMRWRMRYFRSFTKVREALLAGILTHNKIVKTPNFQRPVVGRRTQ